MTAGAGSGSTLPRRAAAKRAVKLAAEQLESSDDGAEHPSASKREPRNHGQSSSKTSHHASDLSRRRLPTKRSAGDSLKIQIESNSSSTESVIRKTSSLSDAYTELGGSNMLRTPKVKQSSTQKRRQSSPIETTHKTASHGRTQEFSPLPQLSSSEEHTYSAFQDEHEIADSSIRSTLGGLYSEREPSHITITSDDEIPLVAYRVDTLVWVRLDSSGNICQRETDTMWWPAQVKSNAPLNINLFGHPPRPQHASNNEVQITRPINGTILSFTTANNNIRFHSHNYSCLSDKRSTMLSPRKRQKTFDLDLHDKWEHAFRQVLEVDRVMNNDGFPRMLSYYDAGDTVDGSSQEINKTLDTSVPEDAEEEWLPPPCNPMYEIPGEPILARETPSATQYWPAKIMAYIPPANRSQKPKYRVLFYDGIMKNLTENQFFTETDEGFKDCTLGEDKNNYDLDEIEEDRSPGIAPLDEELDIRSPSPVPALPPPEDFTFTYNIHEQFQYVKSILVAILQEKYLPVKQRHELFMKSEATRKKVCDSAHEKGELTAAEVEELSTCIRKWIQRRFWRQELGLIPLDEPQGFPEDESVEVTPSNDALVQLPLSQSSGNDTDTDIASEAPFPPPSLFSVISEKEDTASAEKTTQDGHLTQASDPVLRKSFAKLSDIEQLTYCTNILLHEAVLQLLLWRHGLRRTPELLSSDEEERLRGLAEEKAQERYWAALNLRHLHSRHLGYALDDCDFTQDRS